MNILITGTSSGIGYGLALKYLSRKHTVYGISRREPKKLEANSDYHHLCADLTDFNEVTEKLPSFLESANQFDLVILNSGILGEIKLMKEVSIDNMKKVMEINVWANKNLLDLLFKLNIKVNQVVGMSSLAALRSTPGWGSYSLSKAGLDMLMNIYAKEHPDIHFCAFAPGLVDTEITDYVHSIKDVEKYPSAKTLQEARFTERMPDPVTAAHILIKWIEKAQQYESGSHVDVREM